MKLNQKHLLRLEQKLLTGLDLQMMQNIYLLPATGFLEYVTEYCRENPALNIRGDVSKSYGHDFILYSSERIAV